MNALLHPSAALPSSTPGEFAFFEPSAFAATPLRRAITAATRTPEPEAVARLLEGARLPAEMAALASRCYEIFLDAGLPVSLDHLAGIIRGNCLVRIRPAELLPEQLPHASGYGLSPVCTSSSVSPILDFDSYFGLQEV